MSTPKRGDRVRVEYEAEYNYSDDDGRTNVRLLDRCDRYIATVPSGAKIEVLKSPLKVGDVIEGKDAYVALPLGTVIADVYSPLFRTNTGFTDAYGSTFGPRQFEARRVIKFVPEQEAA